MILKVITKRKTRTKKKAQRHRHAICCDVRPLVVVVVVPDFFTGLATVIPTESIVILVEDMLMLMLIVLKVRSLF